MFGILRKKLKQSVETLVKRAERGGEREEKEIDTAPVKKAKEGPKRRVLRPKKKPPKKARERPVEAEEKEESPEDAETEEKPRGFFRLARRRRNSAKRR
jgi:hypothetical protein